MNTIKTIILTLLCSIATTVHAQRISRSYNDRSMSDILIDLDRSTSRYRISFIYNQLEDFNVTKSFEDRPILDALRDVIGFYPIAMSVGDSLITVECIDKTHRRLSGQLIDQNGRPVVFANVQLLSAADSTFITGGVSNENGKFVIPCEQQEALMRVSCIGFKTLEKLVSIGNLGVISLQDDQYAINGVVVKGHHRVDKVDRSVFTFSDEQKKNSRQSQEILTTLPGLRFDDLSGTLKTMTGKSLKILVNGVEATDNDLKSIPVDKIKNVEYYTVPPARYADVGTLINIRTYPLDAGYAAGFDVMQAAWTAFNNTNLYIHYNKGNHQFAFDYNMEYRNNANCESEDSYVFTDGTTVSDYLYRGDYHFGYCNQNFNLKYIYNKENDLTFQAKFSPNLFTQFWRTDNDIEAHNNPLWQNGEGRQERKVRSFGPSLDLYLNKKLNGNQELTVDVLGTYFHNSQNDHNRQWTEAEELLFDDDMRAKNDKISLIGELAYTKNWGKTNLSLGYKATLAKSDYKIRNMLSDYNEYAYTSHNDNHYFYGEIGGKLSKLSYRLGVGGTYVNTDNDLPYKFEAGTPDYVATTGLAKALEYVTHLGMEHIETHERELTRYALEQMRQIEGMHLYGHASDGGDAVISFNVGHIHHLDLGTLLDRLGIAIRTGHHCAEPLIHRLGIEGTCRASFGLYNTKEEVDLLCQGIERVRKMF